jgi:hypothetical protein
MSLVKTISILGNARVNNTQVIVVNLAAQTGTIPVYGNFKAGDILYNYQLFKSNPAVGVTPDSAAITITGNVQNVGNFDAGITAQDINNDIVYEAQGAAVIQNDGDAFNLVIAGGSLTGQLSVKLQFLRTGN